MQDKVPEPRCSSRRGSEVGSVGDGWTQHGERGALVAVGGGVVTLPAGVIGAGHSTSGISSPDCQRKLSQAPVDEHVWTSVAHARLARLRCTSESVRMRYNNV